VLVKCQDSRLDVRTACRLTVIYVMSASGAAATRIAGIASQHARDVGLREIVADMEQVAGVFLGRSQAKQSPELRPAGWKPCPHCS
jgi:hypothetical protein